MIRHPNAVSFGHLGPGFAKQEFADDRWYANPLMQEALSVHQIKAVFSCFRQQEAFGQLDELFAELSVR